MGVALTAGLFAVLGYGDGREPATPRGAAPPCGAPPAPRHEVATTDLDASSSAGLDSSARGAAPPAEPGPASLPAQAADSEPAKPQGPIPIEGVVVDAEGRRRGGIEVGFFASRAPSERSDPVRVPEAGSVGERLLRSARLAFREDYTQGKPWLAARGQTRPDGTYRLEVPRSLNDALAAAGREVKVVAGDPADLRSVGWAGHRLAWDLPSYEFATVGLRRSSRLEVCVRAGGAPLAGAWITLEGRMPSFSERQRSDRSGLTAFEYRELREAQLTVVAPGYAHWARSLERSELQDRVEVELAPEARVRGVVLAEDGSPLSEASVKAKPLDPGALLAVVRARTDATGTFELEGLQPGARYGVSTHERSGDYLSAELEVTPPASGVRLVPRRAGRLGITLVAPPGFDFEGFDCVVERLAEGGAWRQTLSFAHRLDHAELHGEEPRPMPSGQRYAEYRWIAPGDYRVRGVGGSLRESVRLAVRPGETATATLHVVPPRRVRLELPQLSQRSVGIHLTLDGRSHWEWESLDSEGRLELTVAPEVRELVLEAGGYRPLTVALPAGVEDLGALQLEPAQDGGPDDR